MAILEGLANDIVKVVHTEYMKRDNKNRIDEIVDGLFIVFRNKIRPYFSLLAILLVMIVILNCGQFYFLVTSPLEIGGASSSVSSTTTSLSLSPLAPFTPPFTLPFAPPFAPLPSVPSVPSVPSLPLPAIPLALS